MKKRILIILLVVAIIISSMCSCAQADIDETIITHATESEEQAETVPVVSQSETIPLEETSAETQFVYVEQFTEVPLYNQLDYSSTRYGNSTIRKSGCGIVSYAMVLTYLLDREILPDELASMYHKYKVKAGTAYSLFTDTAEDWNVTVEYCCWQAAWGEGKVMEALENNQPVIASVHSDSAFTDGAHLIVLYGLNEDGKILVRDPNGANYMAKGFLEEGFANGFEPSYFRKLSAKYFIYGPKNMDSIVSAAKDELDAITTTALE